jgi:hypothetical protein
VLATSINVANQFDVIQLLREMEPKYFEDFIALLLGLAGYTITNKSKRIKKN